MNTAQFESDKDSLVSYVREQKIPITNLFLFSRALTHRSYLNEHPEALEDNERLEFLGDAVLDFLVGAWLYNHFPEMAEGELTRLRSALVRTEQLAAFAAQIKLGEVMRLGKGESDNGGRQRPPLLCAVFEAVIGAIYLDQGIGKVEEFMEPRLSDAADQIIAAERMEDPKSQFQEYMQARGYNPPVYRTVATRGPDHARIFEVEVIVDQHVYGRGSGPSKQAAAKAAAREALLNIKEADLLSW